MNSGVNWFSKETFIFICLADCFVQSDLGVKQIVINAKEFTMLLKGPAVFLSL